MHASVCDILSDLVQNSIEAGASQVELEVATGSGTIEVRVTDNGIGMDGETLAKAVDPFFSAAGKHDRRRVGLGLPFLYQAAEAANGAVDIQSAPGKGTTVRFSLDAHHVDTPPFGELAETVLGLMAFGGTYDLTLTRRTPTDGYRVSRCELVAALGDLGEAGCLALAKRYLHSQEENLKDK